MAKWRGFFDSRPRGDEAGDWHSSMIVSEILNILASKDELIPLGEVLQSLRDKWDPPTTKEKTNRVKAKKLRRRKRTANWLKALSEVERERRNGKQ